LYTKKKQRQVQIKKSYFENIIGMYFYNLSLNYRFLNNG